MGGQILELLCVKRVMEILQKYIINFAASSGDT